jgi:outer membrane autotransporter protein
MGSYVQPQFTGFIPQNETYDIATVISGGMIVDNSTLIEPPSAVVSFSKTLESNSSVLQLTAHRNAYLSLSNTNVTTGVANSLDVLAQGNGPQSVNLLNLLSQIDHLPDQASVEQAMQSLAPFFNYGLVASSYAGMNMVFEGLHSRVEELRYMNRKAQRGQGYGDLVNTMGIWGKALGENINQSGRDNVAGYRVNAGGLVFGMDTGLSDCITLGITGSYIKATLDDKNITPKDATVESWQGTAYGWFEFARGLYLDTQVAYAHNDYNTNRIIQVNQISTAAIANFHGAQWGAQADLGIAFPYGYYYFSPFARLKYLHLDIESYVEEGADFLSLAVTNSDVDLFMGGIGLKVGGIHQVGNTVWVPEFTALFGADFEDDAELTFANFDGGGPLFTTNGVKPSSTLLDLALGLNIHLNESNIISMKYDLELRSGYISNAGYLQYYYRWGY